MGQIEHIEIERIDKRGQTRPIYIVEKWDIEQLGPTRQLEHIEQIGHMGQAGRTRHIEHIQQL